MNEKVFPRGGRNPALSTKHVKAPSFSLFNKGGKRVKKKVKRKKEIDKEVRNRQPKRKNENLELDVNKELRVKHVEDLTSSVLAEGMLVLGIVTTISDKVVVLSLPGGLRGIVKLNNVSQFYKNLIMNAGSNTEVPSLSDLFHVGELFPGRVISVSEKSRKIFIMTLDPKVINTKLSEMETGMILVGSVKSEEDYGYIIDFGVQSINGFLNFEKIDKEKRKLPIGKLIRCIVTKCTNSIGTSNVELSMLKEDMKKGCLSSDSSCPIHSFIPGFQFSVTVTRVLKNGVEVKYTRNEEFKGYIYEDHLPQLFPDLSKVEVGNTYAATLLYIKPLVNLPYFKCISYKPQSWIYPFGHIAGGKVVKCSKSGVTLRVGNKTFPTKCYIPLSQLSDSEKLAEKEVDLSDVYPAGKEIKEIRLKGIDYMRRCYIGSTDKFSLNEKYFAVSDLKCGEIVSCVIESFEEKVAKVKIGKIRGAVSLVDMTDVPMRNPGLKFKIGQVVKARVTAINAKTHSFRVTMKPTLLKKNLKTLSDYSEAKLNECYTGTVIAVSRQFLMVTFINGVFGKILKKFTPHSDEKSLETHYVCGQLVSCYVVKVIGTKLLLSLTPPIICSLKVGDKYELVVTGIESYGLRVRVNNKKKEESITGMIPSELLCSYPGLGEALLPTFAINQKLTAYYVHQELNCLPIFAICDTVTRFYDILNTEDVVKNDLIRSGAVYPFLYSHVNIKTGDLVLRPVMPCGKYRFYAGKDSIADSNADGRTRIRKHQVVYGNIKEISGRTVKISLKLSDVWDKNFRTSLELLDSYLGAMKRIIDHHREINEDYVKGIHLGSVVTCGDAEQGKIVREVPKASPKTGKGDGNTGVVVWIQGDKKLLCVNTNLEGKEQVPDEEFQLDNGTYRAVIVYIGEEVVVASLRGKGNGKLVCLPRKRHANDFLNAKCPYQIGTELRVWLERGRMNNLVGLDRQVKLLEEKKIWKAQQEELHKCMKAAKRKIPRDEGWKNGGGKMMRMENGEETERLPGNTGVTEAEDAGSDGEVRCVYMGVNTEEISMGEIKQEVESDECMDVSMTSEGGLDVTAVDIKSEEESDEDGGKEKEKANDIYRKERILLSSSSDSEESDDESIPVGLQNGSNLNVGFDWNVITHRELLSNAIAKPEDYSSSSSEDEEENKNAKKKRVRLTKSEREEMARAEEERLRQIEERLIRSDVEPETADDFDRALLGKPNSSALWVKYMAFHLQATEIEKARTVARRALKTISFNEEQEKLNVWLALLNLENLYGNEESLNKTLSEALTYNEPFHIHLHMMNVHGQSGKFHEMERIGNLLMKKFKDSENMWESVGLAYFKVGRLESARHVMQRALPLLPKNKHVELISQFAQMENRYGSRERAQTLYETILGSFPKRVDVWSCYVDMLVKSDLIELARQVLERATSQNLPPKKMKVLFKKFIGFEEKYGDAEKVEKVRESAVDYVKSVGK